MDKLIEEKLKSIDKIMELIVSMERGEWGDTRYSEEAIEKLKKLFTKSLLRAEQRGAENILKQLHGDCQNHIMNDDMKMFYGGVELWLVECESNLDVIG